MRSIPSTNLDRLFTLLLACIGLCLSVVTLHSSSQEEPILLGEYEFLFICIALACFCLNGAASIWHLVVRKDEADALAVASVRVGLVYCFGSIATSVVWARVAAGVWWIRDPMSTATFLITFMYLCYLILRQVQSPGRVSASASTFGVFVFLDIPLVYVAAWLEIRHSKTPSTLHRVFELTFPRATAFLVLAIFAVATQYRLIRTRQLRMEEETSQND